MWYLDHFATIGKARLKDKSLCKHCQSKMIRKKQGFSSPPELLTMGKKRILSTVQTSWVRAFVSWRQKFPVNTQERVSADGHRRIPENIPTTTKCRESITTNYGCQQARGLLMTWVWVPDQARQDTYLGKTQLSNGVRTATQKVKDRSPGSITGDKINKEKRKKLPFPNQSCAKRSSHLVFLTLHIKRRSGEIKCLPQVSTQSTAGLGFKAGSDSEVQGPSIASCFLPSQETR